MEVDRIRAIIAIIIVVGFMIITGFLAVFPLMSSMAVTLDSYSDFLGKTVGIYSGIVGVIIGYYFGKAKSTDKKS